MDRKLPWPDGEERFQRVLDDIRKITPEQLQAIFDRYDQEKPETKGNGRGSTAASKTTPGNGSKRPKSATAPKA